MKTHTIIIIFALLGLTSSCEMEKLPGDRIAREIAFQTLKDAEDFRVGNYSLFRIANYNSRKQLTDFQADIANAVVNYSNASGGALYAWQDRIAEEASIRNFYSTSYSALANINSLIENIDNIKVENASETAKIQNYKGEAYLMRAHIFHSLVLHFAKAYNPSTADTDLGIPLTLKYDISEKLPRASIKETYNQIQADLDQAKALMNVEGSPESTKLTKDFAHAIQARISLERQEWTNAIAAADLIINKYALVSTREKLDSLWRYDSATEIVVGLYVSNIEGKSPAQPYLSYSNSSRNYRPDFVPSKKVVEAYQDGDFRKNTYLTTQTTLTGGVVYQNVILINKYPGNPNFNTTATTNQYVHKPKLFMAAEAYLIKAEAQARGNIGDAIATLNILSEARNGGTLAGDPLTLVKEERFREMLAEGQRLHDLRRWGEPLNRTGGQAVFGNAGLYTINNAPTMQKPVTDRMWVWEFPIQELQANRNLIPNWR